MSNLKIHVVVFRNGDLFVAQCLEYDIATQAPTVPKILYEVERIIAAHLLMAEKEGGEPFAHLPKAPKRFWQMYKDANARLGSVRPAGFPPGKGPVLELRAT